MCSDSKLFPLESKNEVLDTRTIFFLDGLASPTLVTAVGTNPTIVDRTTNNPKETPIVILELTFSFVDVPPDARTFVELLEISRASVSPAFCRPHRSIRSTKEFSYIAFCSPRHSQVTVIH